MHGTNPIAAARRPEDGFAVHSMFFTIQGEGPHVGRPAIFIRLAHCNLRCVWCDTEFETGQEYTAPDLIKTIGAQVDAHNCRFLVITGGEPLLQPLNLLIDAPELAHCEFQMETAGSVWPTGNLTNAAVKYPRLSIVCSPKTPVLHPMLRNCLIHDVYWKYIVRASEPIDPDDGLPVFSTQLAGKRARLFRPLLPQMRSRIFVQACDENDERLNYNNRSYAAAIAMKYGYRLSVQIHKILELA
jgi:organic radical activating enzyme